jgi:hypothetical protein
VETPVAACGRICAVADTQTIVTSAALGIRSSARAKYATLAIRLPSPFSDD